MSGGRKWRRSPSRGEGAISRLETWSWNSSRGGTGGVVGEGAPFSARPRTGFTLKVSVVVTVMLEGEVGARSSEGLALGGGFGGTGLLCGVEGVLEALLNDENERVSSRRTSSREDKLRLREDLSFGMGGAGREGARASPPDGEATPVLTDAFPKLEKERSVGGPGGEVREAGVEDGLLAKLVPQNSEREPTSESIPKIPL